MSQLRLATWNVRTMCPGLDEDLQKVTNARKTAIIDRELSRLNLDIVALQETRLSSFGSLKEKNYTFFWQGLEPEEHSWRRIRHQEHPPLFSGTPLPGYGKNSLFSSPHSSWVC